MTKRNLLRSVLIGITCAAAAWAQGTPVIPTGGIPQLKITTRNNQTPGTTTSNTASCGSNSGKCGSTAAGGGVFPYMQMTDFELTVPGNPGMNVRRTAQPDSLRRRGNSTATASKIPFRIKFDEKTSLFGRPAARSWVLLANFYDNSNALNSVAFELGRRLGLHGTPTVQYVELTLNGTYRGIYQLTEQVQVNPGRVDIDEDFGWLVEIDYHQPDRTECDAWFHVDASCLGFFIKSPEDLPASQLAFVRNDVTALTTAVRASGNAYRELIDMESFAKYLLIQQAMDNFDFNSKVEGGGMGNGNQYGLPGSNFMYKDACTGSRIQAGPLWDFDLSAGVPAPGGMGFPGGGGGCAWPSHYCETNVAMRPRNAFYQKMWDDPAFQRILKDVWTRHKSDFDAMPQFVDQIATHLRSRIAANCASASYQGGGGIWGMGGGCTSSYTETSYMNEIGQLKTWWTQRMTFVNGQITALTGNEAYTQTPVTCTPGQTTTVSLSVSRSPTAGGNVSVTVGSGNAQSNPATLTITSGTRVAVTAIANDGYVFSHWTGQSSSVDSTSATISWNISADRPNLTANFAPAGSVQTYTLTVTRNPSSGAGDITINGVTNNQGTPSTHNAGSQITVAAIPRSGYTFVNWTAASGSIPSGITATNPNISFSINANTALVANFQQGGTDPGGDGCANNIVQNGGFPGAGLNGTAWQITNNTTGGASLDVSVSGGKLTLNPMTPGQEAYQPQLIQTGISLASGNTYRLTFTANAVSGTRSMMTMLQQSSGNYTVYGAEKTHSLTTTAQTFTHDVTMTSTDANVQLAFNFGGSLGTGGVVISDVCLVSAIPSSVGHVGPPRHSVATAVLRTNARGVTALLPANHGYTSYKLIDLQGREIKSGRIGAGTTELRFGNIRTGVVFLKLEGAGSSTILRTAAVR